MIILVIYLFFYYFTIVEGGCDSYSHCTEGSLRFATLANYFLFCVYFVNNSNVLLEGTFRTLGVE